MIEAFEIGVSLALRDGVSDGLAKARRDVVALENAVRGGGISMQSLRDAAAHALGAPVSARVTEAEQKKPSPAASEAQPMAEMGRAVQPPVSTEHERREPAIAYPATAPLSDGSGFQMRAQSAPASEPALPAVIPPGWMPPAALDAPVFVQQPFSGGRFQAQPEGFAADVQPVAPAPPLPGLAAVVTQQAAPPAQNIDWARPVASEVAWSPPVGGMPNAVQHATARLPEGPGEQGRAFAGLGAASGQAAPLKAEWLGVGGQGSAAPPAQKQDTGPREGDVFLDGTLVGRWMSRHLNREAERASVGPTGFDARRSRLMPGVTVGG